MADAGGKYVKDAVHGYIKISPLCVKIIDTPEFQRLRNIRQMGFVAFVYPSANHTRFEHCIGVSNLAGKMAEQLLKPLNYTKDDEEIWIKCAEVAGLSHDLGHGPFSHDFEIRLAAEVKHEEMSIRFFDRVCKYESIKNCISEEERDIVKAMILPEKDSNDLFKEHFLKMYFQYPDTIAKYPNKEFMFQIVSNDENGIDVDKWDYLTRDSFYLGQNSNFDYMRLFAHAKVLNVDGKMHICYPLKLREHIHAIYHLRRWNFKHACQHRVVLCVSLMFADAVKQANKKLSYELTDAVYYDLRETSELIKKIESRDLYISLGGIPKKLLFRNRDLEESDENAIDMFLDIFADVNGIPSKEELRVGSQSFKYGKIAKDHFRRIYFYSKYDPENAQSLPEADIDAMFAAAFAEPTFFFYSTRDGKFTELQERIRSFSNDLN